MRAVQPRLAAALGLIVGVIGCGRPAVPPPPATGPAVDPALLARAEQGDLPAMVELAERYRIDAASRDQARAIAWYTQAAVKGHGGAMLMLARFYRTGDGLRRDPVQARQWLEKAAAVGQPLALYHLGEMQRLGEGTPVNRGEAARYYRAAIQAPGARESTIKLASERLAELGLQP